jgi:DNA-directed RNA polymerase subunit RPC12/RpoP
MHSWVTVPFDEEEPSCVRCGQAFSPCIPGEEDWEEDDYNLCRQCAVALLRQHVTLLKLTERSAREYALKRIVWDVMMRRIEYHCKMRKRKDQRAIDDATERVARKGAKQYVKSVR